MASHNDHDFGGPRNQCPYCMADRIAESRSREGELVAALEHIFVTAEEQIAKFPADGYWLSVRDTAALAQGEKE